MLHQKLVDISQTRAQAGPLPTASAPFTRSNFFKVQPLGVKPKARCWDHRFSANSLLQSDSPLKEAARSSNPLDLITLGTARPAPEYFPWTAMDMRGVDIKTKSVADVPLSMSMSCSKGDAAFDLAVALNYGYSAGSPQVLRFITEHIEMIHNPPYDDWESSITCGTTSAMEMAFRIFCNSGDTVMMEDHTYSGTIAAATAQELHVLSIRMDDQGIVPEDLDAKLENWDLSKGRKPFLLYTVPTGQNPTGTTQPIERRRKIYQLAEKHDLYIMEDDPYFFLQLGRYTPDAAPRDPADLENYLSKLPLSYLSLDTSGRVLRMDSTSKILAPGLRCGWITASSQVIRKFLGYSEVGVLSPSGPSQVMVHKLLDEAWGHEGFLTWLSSLSAHYSRRRDALLAACARALPADLCDWTVPTDGMFLWIRVRTPAGLEGKRSALLDLEQRIFAQAVQLGVLPSRGSWFNSDVENLDAVCLRITFAAAPEESLAVAVERLGEAIKREVASV